MSLIPWCATLTANHCSWTAHAKIHVFCLLTDRLLTDGTAGRAAAAWTTTADGDDLVGLIPERIVDSDTVAAYRSRLGMPWAPV